MSIYVFFTVWFLQYLWYALIDFYKTFFVDASSDEDNLLCFVSGLQNMSKNPSKYKELDDIKFQP